MSSTSPPPPAPSDTVPAHRGNPVVAFIIGLAIILLASILNAAGLNLTKLDHVRTSSIPKASRKKDWMRPLWLLGMVLYILSQLIGSTLALEYMRAEYVAPLGSSSLIFNFLFARFLVGTPVTSTDIYGTIVVILGVIGIVAFGSINSGLTSDVDAAYLTRLWRRGGWLGYFFAMSIALFLVLVFTSRLDFILSSRADLAAVPFSGNPNSSQPPLPTHSRQFQGGGRRKSFITRFVGFFLAIKSIWDSSINFVTDMLEIWSGPKDDTQIAWTLGIGWACCGGGLAGACLVFAKATVKMLSGSLSHQNTGNQFGHVSVIMTIILLVITAVMQIICLNRGLKIYDSTLVVPVFYGVYTAVGWLDSLIFNNEVQAYQSWTLFLIFVSILILISGVVLLTHKKPEPVTGIVKTAVPQRRRRKRKDKKNTTVDGEEGQENEEQGDGEDQVLWTLGEASDESDGEDDDIDHHQNPQNHSANLHRTVVPRRRSGGVGEQTGLVEQEDEHPYSARAASSGRRSMDPFVDDEDTNEYPRHPEGSSLHLPRR